jgi:hypothetical protein
MADEQLQLASCYDSETISFSFPLDQANMILLFLNKSQSIEVKSLLNLTRQLKALQLNAALGFLVQILITRQYYVKSLFLGSNRRFGSVEFFLMHHNTSALRLIALL